jgi:hypothetical protein
LNGSVPVLVELVSEHPLEGIRFWLDGIQIGTVLPDSPGISARFDFPSARLEGDGWHTLYATAMDQTGRATLSNAVHITSSPPVGMETIHVAKKGDSLNSIAGLYRLDPAKIQIRNSGWSGEATDELPVGSLVIIPFDPPSAAPQMDLMVEGMQLQFSTGMPEAPSIEAKVDECSVVLTMQALAGEAGGFVLYRLDSNGDRFMQVAHFEGGQTSPLVFQDKTAAGTVQYIASVYTDQGEALGDPIEITLTGQSCTNSTNLPVSGSVLSLPSGMSGVYFYVSVNGNGYYRYPASEAEFLNLEGGTFDLKDLISNDDLNMVKSEIALEAWTWDSGQLSQVGDAFARIDANSELLICPTGTNCGGTGEFITHYSNSAVIGSDQENQVRTFKWKIDSPTAASFQSVLFQLSLQPFTGGIDGNPPGLAYSKVLSGALSSDITVGGTFNLDFKTFGDFLALDQVQVTDPSLIISGESESQIQVDQWISGQYEKYNPENSGSPFSLPQGLNLTNDFSNVPRTYFARFIPLSGGKQTQPSSNVVTIEYRPTGTEQIEVLPENPSIFEIKILSSSAPVPPTAHWGCVDVLAVNPNSYVWTNPGWFQGRLPEFEGYLNNHQPYCPPPYKPAEKAWYEDFWDWVNEGLDFIDEIYQAAKNLSVDYMLAQWDLIDSVTGIWDVCGCRDEVYAGLMKGQEWVLKYQYGLPADLPNLNQLTEEGIDELAAQALKYAGLDGDACPQEILDCEKFLADFIRKLRDEFIQQSVAVYQDDAIAHGHGYYALLLPADPTAITVGPAKTLNWQMAEAVVRVTRKSEATSLTETQIENLSFTLDASVYAVNETCRNRTHPFCVDVVTINGAPGACAEQSVILPDAPCEGMLFSGYRSIPLLAPGESMTFTVKMLPQEYWATPEEYKVYNPQSDFDLLYYDAQAEISARLSANSYLMKDATDGPAPFILTDLNTSGLLGGY